MWYDFIRGEVDRQAFIQHFFWKLRRFAELREHFGSREAATINCSLASTTWLSDWLDLWLGISSNYQVRSLAGAGGGAAFLESPTAAEKHGEHLDFYVLGWIFNPRGPGTRKINDCLQNSITNMSILAEIGFQKLRIGSGSVLTKYKPVVGGVHLV